MMLGENLTGLDGIEVRYGNIPTAVCVAAEVLSICPPTESGLESCGYGFWRHSAVERELWIRD